MLKRKGNSHRMLHSDADLDDLVKLYDDQFLRFLCICEGFVNKLSLKQDRQICTSWIQMLCDLESQDVEIKRNRNAFFQYFLQVVQQAFLEEDGNYAHLSHQHINEGKTQDINAVQDPIWLEQKLNDLEFLKSDHRRTSYFTHWSKDHRTYTATKALPQGGALIYMAVSKDPTLGWENLTRTETKDDT